MQSCLITMRDNVSTSGTARNKLLVTLCAMRGRRCDASALRGSRNNKMLRRLMVAMTCDCSDTCRTSAWSAKLETKFRPLSTAALEGLSTTVAPRTDRLDMHVKLVCCQTTHHERHHSFEPDDCLSHRMRWLLRAVIITPHQYPRRLRGDRTRIDSARRYAPLVLKLAHRMTMVGRHNGVPGRHTIEYRATRPPHARRLNLLMQPCLCPLVKWGSTGRCPVIVILDASLRDDSPAFTRWK
jgi:hypothetical protein